ncbi:dynein axonemal intermediate chain 7 [Spea bombifrons]|uniref:dynein axonemal intermediate chain 7 n=1 Tax=Spea bombifrons TaxID=233779 RepID=UPI00234B419F|nr:dynein axonemal intermediate chain 7 [Spea bombifrons]
MRPKKRKKKKSSKRTSAASGKKGKISKAERLRLQKEEEDRRHQEEEEARLLAEQEEAEQRERERAAKEERERLEAKLLERRDEELEEYRTLLEEKIEEAGRWKRHLRIQAKWDRYLRCDGTPDPSIPQEINTFISLWTEEQNEDLQSVLSKSSLVLKLIEELEFLLDETPADELPEAEAARYLQTVLELQELLQQKFNDATQHLLKDAAALADVDSGNMQKVIGNEDVSVCVWANLNKNPRFRGYEFTEAAVGFELPKPLAACGVAVRVLRTAYDHLSCQSRTFFPRVTEADGEKEAGAGRVPEERIPGERSAAAEEELTVQDRKSVLSALSTREETKSATEAPETNPSESENAGAGRPGDASQAGPSPSPLLNEDQADDALEDDVVDLRQYTTLGGIYFFDVITLPPQRKQVKSWTMVQLLEGGIEFFSYPNGTSLTSLSSYLGTSLQEKDMETLSAPPVGVSFRVPKNVIFFEEPQVARWDPESKNWKTDAVTQKTYNPELRELSFKMDAFHTFTLIQDSHLNMPYESWELRPRGRNRLTLTIASAFTDIQIDVEEDRCRLAAVSNTESDLSHLVGKWMTLFHLKSAMRRVGLNVFPAADSARYVIVNKKDEEAENMAYKEMALLSASFAFGWSKWNHSCGSEQIVIKVKEHAEADAPGEDVRSLYLLSPRRTQRLKICEDSELFSEELHAGSEFHSTLHHAIREHAGAGAMEALKLSQPLFADAVYQLLNATRVLSYS